MPWIALSESDADTDTLEKCFRVTAEQPTIGKTVDDPMVAIERDWQLASAGVRHWN